MIVIRKDVLKNEHLLGKRPTTWFPYAFDAFFNSGLYYKDYISSYSQSNQYCASTGNVVAAPEFPDAGDNNT